MLTSKKEENGNVGLYYVNQFPGTVHNIAYNICATAQTACSGKGTNRIEVPEGVNEIKITEAPAGKNFGIRVDALRRGRLISEPCVTGTYQLSEGGLKLHGSIHRTGKAPDDSPISPTDILHNPKTQGAPTSRGGLR